MKKIDRICERHESTQTQAARILFELAHQPPAEAATARAGSTARLRTSPNSAVKICSAAQAMTAPSSATTRNSRSAAYKSLFERGSSVSFVAELFQQRVDAGDIAQPRAPNRQLGPASV